MIARVFVEITEKTPRAIDIATTRLESGRSRHSMRTLERLAKATGWRLLIRFGPIEASQGS